MNLPDWPCPILHLNSVDSTQDLARRMAEEGAPEWSLVIADRQTQGRGRMSREWNSCKGGLYLSLILRPKIQPSLLARLSLTTADAVAQALTAVTGLKTTVKPPNDVLARPSSLTPTLSHNGRGNRKLPLAPRERGQGEGDWYKICGILAEASGNSHCTDWVVIGIGINVNNRIPPGLPHAASLAQLSGRPWEIKDICQKTLEQFHKKYNKLIQETRGPLLRPKTANAVKFPPLK